MLKLTMMNSTWFSFQFVSALVNNVQFQQQAGDNISTSI